MKIVFFRTPKAKQFNYPPRYYDAEKERWEQRKRELGLSKEGKADFSTRVSSNWQRFRKIDRSRKRKSEMSVLVYLIIAALLVYYVFFA